MRCLLAFTIAMVEWFSAGSLAATPILSVVRSANAGDALLSNGGFERATGGTFASWQAAPRGWQPGAGEGRAGSAALKCVSPTGEGWFGASQAVTLNRTNAAPLIVRGWSRAENVSGGADSGYALYVDLLYADGTPLWGQTANFHCGTHDWEVREFTILPEKPVKSLTLHCLLRGHSGTVWFDDVSVAELSAAAGAVLFQGVPVRRMPISNLKSQISDRLATADGLALGQSGDGVGSLQIDGRELAGTSPSGFLARDVAADSGFFGFAAGQCAELGLKVQAEFTARSNHIEVRGRLADLAGRDRAITLVFALPVEAAGWRWGDDIRRARIIQGDAEYATSVAVRCGSTGTMSLYPLGAIWKPSAGLAIALDLAQPAVYRVGYHAGTQQLFIAYDFGLVRDTERFPGAAEFRFVLYRFDPQAGFRAAFEKFTRIFPEHFVVRSREQGIWMPFTDVSRVQGWEDFGFRYHEGNNNVPWDDAHGVLSFRYTEPMTWWMPMAKELPRTASEAIRARDELTRTGNASQRQMAVVSQVAAMHDETGRPSLLFRNEPWCNGAVWSLNPNPYLGTNPPAASLNAATVHWSEPIKTRLYGAEAKGKLDGEYLDSLEGYVTAELNYRRDHFRATTVPLTFDPQSKQPALFKGLAVFEFTRWIADDVHGLGKLMFANGVPYRFPFLCPWLDVMGTETDWLRDGKYEPASDAQMSLWRTMSGGKPYVLLMNTDYNAFGPEMVEKYFQRCLFYGMFPGFFSHNAAENPYWENPRWYNRDRPLFKKYLPLIKRVAEAGWQPVTQAACDNDRLWVERFGPGSNGEVYLTVYNDTAQRQSGVLRLTGPGLTVPDGVAPKDLLTGKPFAAVGGGWAIELEPQRTAVLQVEP